MKIVLIPIIDTPCVCRACKKEFIILKEQMLENYRQCTWCGSLKWQYKEDIKNQNNNLINYNGLV